jgi:hypothetical protein
MKKVSNLFEELEKNNKTQLNYSKHNDDYILSLRRNSDLHSSDLKQILTRLLKVEKDTSIINNALGIFTIDENDRVLTDQDVRRNITYDAIKNINDDSRSFLEKESIVKGIRQLITNDLKLDIEALTTDLQSVKAKQSLDHSLISPIVFNDPNTANSLNIVEYKTDYTRDVTDLYSKIDHLENMVSHISSQYLSFSQDNHQIDQIDHDLIHPPNSEPTFDDDDLVKLADNVRKITVEQTAALNEVCLI